MPLRQPRPAPLRLLPALLLLRPAPLRPPLALLLPQARLPTLTRRRPPALPQQVATVQRALPVRLPLASTP